MARRKKRSFNAPGVVQTLPEAKERDLTDLEWMAINHYFSPEVNYSRREAVRRAGGSPGSASAMFKRPEVIAEVDRRRAELARKFDIGAADVVKEMAKLAFFNVGDYLNEDGSLDVDGMDRDNLAALTGLDIDETIGDDGQVTRRKYRLKANKLEALEKLMKNLGLLNTQVDVNVKTDLAQQIIEARHRIRAEEATLVEEETE